MPKISVLIPVYNAEKYLNKCIQSVISQSLKNIEIIIINDGSNDSSLEIIKSFKDERIKLFNKKNSGYGASLNLAINKAQGEYISILEADDFMHENMLETLYDAPKCDVIKSGFYFYPDNTIYNLNIEGYTSIDDNPQIINIKPSVWSAIYKKDFLQKNNILFSETKGACYQDISFHFKTMFLAKSIFFINKPLYYYRCNNDRSSVNSKLNPQAVFKEFKLIDEFLTNYRILPETYAQLILFKLKVYIWNYMRVSEIFEKECIALSSQDLSKENLSAFYKSRYIKIKDKIKLFMLTKNITLMKNLLKIVKSNKGI